jgi:transcriptional regulator with XRE-family HTH domain
MTAITPSTWIPRDTFAARLLIARTQRNLNQQEAADACALTRATWSTWERGNTPRHQAEVARLISVGLDVDLMWLLYGGPLTPDE